MCVILYRRSVVASLRWKVLVGIYTVFCVDIYPQCVVNLSPFSDERQISSNHKFYATLSEDLSEDLPEEAKVWCPTMSYTQPGPPYLHYFLFAPRVTLRFLQFSSGQLHGICFCHICKAFSYHFPRPRFILCTLYPSSLHPISVLPKAK